MNGLRLKNRVWFELCLFEKGKVAVGGRFAFYYFYRSYLICFGKNRTALLENFFYLVETLFTGQ